MPILGIWLIWFGPQTADRRQAVASRAEVHFGPEGGNFDRREGCMGKRVQRHETEGHAVLEHRRVQGDRAQLELRRLLAHGRQFDTVVLPLLGWPYLRMTLPPERRARKFLISAQRLPICRPCLP